MSFLSFEVTLALLFLYIFISLLLFTHLLPLSNLRQPRRARASRRGRKGGESGGAEDSGTKDDREEDGAGGEDNSADEFRARRPGWGTLSLELYGTSVLTDSRCARLYGAVGGARCDTFSTRASTRRSTGAGVQVRKRVMPFLQGARAHHRPKMLAAPPP